MTLIQEIEENPERTLESLKGMDLVVCGFNHLGEFKKALPKSPVQAVGLLMARPMSRQWKFLIAYRRERPWD